MKRIPTIALLTTWILALAAGCAPTPALPSVTPSVPAAPTQPAPTAALPLEPAALLTPAEAKTAVPVLTPTPAAATAPIPTWPPPPENRPRYTLKARLDYNRHSLAVEERIEYTNTTPQSLAELPLVVDALRYPHTFELTGAVDAAGQPLRTHIKDITLTLRLPTALEPGESTQVALQYGLALPDVTRLPQLRPYPLGYTSTAANFGDWYPFIPPYVEGKGWLIHSPAMYGEYLAYDVADFDVRIQLVGNLTDLVVAAGTSGAVETGPDGEWRRYQHAARRSFAWSASPYYEVITQTVQTEAGGEVLLASYYFSFHEQAGKSLLGAMARAVPLYSRLFGAYPHPQLSGVQADFLDGMEYDGLFFLSTDFYNWHKDTPDDFLMALGAHETAHQWWMALVGSDPAAEPWLDEALCTYSEAIFYENEFPEVLDWWWTYRVNYYEPEGWVDIRVDEVPAVAGQYRLYRDPVYLRGALFLEELRKAMGDEPFFRALRLYAANYEYSRASAAGFFEIFQEQTEQSLTPVIEKYFENP